VEKNFDFSLGGMIRQFDFGRMPSLSAGGFYRKLASYGHFGRTDMGLPWEETDKAEVLRSS